MGERTSWRTRAVELWWDLISGGWTFVLVGASAALVGFFASVPVYLVLSVFGVEWTYWIWAGLSIVTAMIITGRAERDDKPARNPFRMDRQY